MAKDENRRLSPRKVQKDKDSFAALLKINGYKPIDHAFTIHKGTNLAAELLAADAVETQAKNAHDKAKAAAVQYEWDLHNFIQGVKLQVAAQFTEDSDEYQSLGLKKKKNYKRPKRKPKNPPKQ